MRTRKNASITIGFKLAVREINPGRVEIQIDYECNPTRTLADLLNRFCDIDDIHQVVSEISAVEFFTETPGVPLSLDHRTNWITNPDQAHRAFGNDVFTTFLPIYVMQLRALSSVLVSPTFHSRSEEEGAEDVIRSEAYEVRLDWCHAAAPQAETYFERHHGSAQAVVRSAAQNVLTRLNDATVRHYFNETGFDRRGNLFSMRCRLSLERELSIYAKDHNRLRFEISRKKAGRYPVPVQPGASGRLLAIMRSEREALLTALEWRVVSELLAEHPVPIVDDLVSLVALTSDACTATGANFRATISSLITDGGFSETEGNTALIASLVRSGIIERTTLQQRERGWPRRFALRGEYLVTFEVILDALSTNVDAAN